MLQFRTDITTLYDLGCRVTSVAGDVAAVSVPVNSLDSLKEHPEVVFVEASRPLKDETDVSAVAINLIDPVTLLRTIPGSGAGALIGVIDSGFDLTHPCFTNSEGTKTRILAAWDQANLDQIGGAPPPGFGYGIEFQRDFLNELLAAKKILVTRNQDGAGPHGTYVSGIAAGNGAPHRVYKGMAPEAELILVTYRNDVPVGGSAFVLDAIHYIRERAQACGRPAVINLSQGDNLGAHDGTSLLERAIDNVVRQGEALVVVSAGNERNGPVSHHARGEVERGRDFTLPFTLTSDAGHPVDGDTIELWYRGGDRFAVALKTPGGRTSRFVMPGETRVLDFASNRAHVYSEVGHPTNGDNHVGIILEKGAGWEAGTWGLILRGEELRRGDFDAWVDRPHGVTVLGFRDFKSDAVTVTLPGNARRAITVGSFVSRPSERINIVEVRGMIELGSSFGPTRDGRLKPDLVAPGSLIMAPRIRLDSCLTCYDPERGTSMAAPHVAGVIALLWALRPDLTAAQIHAALYSTARSDTFTGATPNTSCGYGKLDAEAAYEAINNLVKNGGTAVREEDEVFEFTLGPQPKKSSGDMAGMTVRIVVRNGNLVTITGESEGESYEGVLTLRKKDREDEGDECWVCDVPDTPCHWEDPCPVGGGD